MSFMLGLIYLIVTGAVLASMAALFFRGERTLCNHVYMVCQGMAALWCGSQILVLLAETKWELTVSYLIGNIGICFIGAFWYYFAVLYTGGRLEGFNKYVPVTLSLFHYLLVLTNSWHHLYYTVFSSDKIVHGQFFYSNVVITYAFVIVT